MLKFINRICFGKRHKTVKKRSFEETLSQLSHLSEESKQYICDNYQLVVDEVIQERDNRTHNNARSTIHISLKEKSSD